MKNNIKEIRQSVGMTQEELAKASGVSRATIATLESDEAKVTTTKTLVKIASALGCPVESLFF